MPKVTIVTPCLNQGKFLEQTILSVLNQNYPNIEYILIDGGSTDGTLDIIKKYEKDISYWISEKDRGMYDATNKGLKHSSGSILAYLNSDDIYRPNTIQAVVEYLQKHPETSMVFGNTDYIDAEGDFLYSYRYPAFKYARYIQLNWSSIPQQASFWRRRVHDTIGYFNADFKLAGDFDFFARLGKNLQIDHVNQVLAAQRFHCETLSCIKAKVNIEEVKKIHQDHCVNTGLSGASRRMMYDLQIKLLNLPLMLKKLTRIQGRTKR